jgi:Reverse transcriptase (RNA-dependent DNA polymerase)/Aspartyl protease
MLLLWSAGTRLSLLFEEDHRTSEACPSQNSNSGGRHHIDSKCDESDDDSHPRKRTQFP